jgi:hypothetical protein
MCREGQNALSPLAGESWRGGYVARAAKGSVLTNLRRLTQKSPHLWSGTPPSLALPRKGGGDNKKVEGHMRQYASAWSMLKL